MCVHTKDSYRSMVMNLEKLKARSRLKNSIGTRVYSNFSNNGAYTKSK